MHIHPFCFNIDTCYLHVFKFTSIYLPLKPSGVFFIQIIIAFILRNLRLCIFQVIRDEDFKS